MPADAPGEPPSNGDLGPDPGHSSPGHPAAPDAAAHTGEPAAAAAGAGGGGGAQSSEASEPHPAGDSAAHESSGERRGSGTEAGVSQEAADEPEGGAAGAAERGYGAPAGLPHVQGGTPGRSDGGDEAAAPAGTCLYKFNMIKWSVPGACWPGEGPTHMPGQCMVCRVRMSLCVRKK